VVDYTNPVVPVRFERAVRDRLRDIASQRGMSVSAVVREQVLRHLRDLDRWAEPALVAAERR
jgi:hypothetical protein